MAERIHSQMQAPIAPIAPIDVDLAGQRLLMDVSAACEASATFPEQVVAALHTALECFSAQSDLRCLLLAPGASADLAKRQIHWQQVFAARLRAAAKRRAGTQAPPMFLESTLMVNVGAQIGDWLAAGDLQPLGARVVTLAELILTYYPEPAGNGASEAPHE
jgi:hypothetical protein